MDLQIDAEKIKSLRGSRAWSQEHLSHVAGIGRRTIQRVEKSGSASYETAKAIASAFDINVAELIHPETVKIESIRKQNSLLRKISVSLTSIIVVMLFALTRSVTADQVKLDIEAVVDSEQQTATSVTNEEGHAARIQLAENFRVTVTPSITADGDVQLELLLLRHDGDSYRQVGAPVIRTPFGETALLKSNSDDGQSLSLEITPSIP